jgi:hypothetical protein
MLDCVRPPLPLSPATVYREANLNIRPFVDQMIEKSLVEPSEIHGLSNLETLFSEAQRGSACLLLVEHFSNFDLPVLSYLLRQNGDPGQKIAEALIAVAGMKLDVECPIVAAFAEAYRRIKIVDAQLGRLAVGIRDARLHTDPIADGQMFDSLADVGDGAGRLMAKNHWLSHHKGPNGPVGIVVDIAATDADRVDGNTHIMRPHGLVEFDVA